ncbi:MAG: hypothetical protein WB930_12640 [Syntrophobacteraceae bacterium]
MGRTVKSLELRTAEGKLIVSLYLVEKEVDSEGKKNWEGNKRPESKPEKNSGNGSPNSEAMTEAQRRYLFRILAEQGIEGDAAFERLKSLFDVSVLKEVSKRDASKMIERLLEEQGGVSDGPPF